MRLSEHFTLEELTRSFTATRLGIDNTPDEAVFYNLKRLARRLEEVRELVGGPIIVTSGYRCPKLNRAIKGARNSAHMKGLAADIVAKAPWTVYELAELIVASKIDYDKTIFEFGEWVHFQIEPAGKAPEMRVFTAVKEDGKTVYKSGLWD